MNGYVYVFYLIGKHVSNNWSIQGVIKHFNELDKVRTMIKERHGIEFAKRGIYYDSYLQFKNITDDRDIRLVLTTTNVIY